MAKRAKLVLVSGGTGGHLFPALALGKVLQDKKHNVHYITDKRGRKHIQGRADARHILSVNHRAGKIKKYVNIFRDFFSCLILFIRIRPHAVMGFGGYPTLAPLAAAIVLRIPVALHEQNALLGRANRALAKYAKKIALSFDHVWANPELSETCKGKKFVVTGNPVRHVIHAEEVPEKLKLFHILVIGGSQGAKIFCDLLPPTIALMPKSYQKQIRLEQQCRPEYIDKTIDKYEDLKINATLSSFIEDIGVAYDHADLVICRSGASTIAELIALGKPAILVPLPTSADNHQFHNAKEIDDNKGGWVYEQKDLTPEILAEKIKTLMDKPKLLVDAGKKAEKMSRPNATKDLAKMILSLYTTKV